MFNHYLPWHKRVAPPDEKPYTAEEFSAVLAAVCKKAEIPIRSAGDLVYSVGHGCGHKPNPDWDRIENRTKVRTLCKLLRSY
jgi:hypothetical protein